MSSRQWIQYGTVLRKNYTLDDPNPSFDEHTPRSHHDAVADAPIAAERDQRRYQLSDLPETISLL